MPFFQNLFCEEFRGNWVLYDRQHIPTFVCKANAGRGADFVVAWNRPSNAPTVTAFPAFLTTSTYSLGSIVNYGGNLYLCTTANGPGLWNSNNWTLSNKTLPPTDSTESPFAPTYNLTGNTTLTLQFALDTEMYRNWATLSIDLTASTAFSTGTAYVVGNGVSYSGSNYVCTTANRPGAWNAANWTLSSPTNARTLSDIIFTLRQNATFNTWFKADLEVWSKGDTFGRTKLIIKQKHPTTRLKFFVVNTGAATVFNFNAKAGVAEMPSYFQRHTVGNFNPSGDGVTTVPYRFYYPDAQNELVLLNAGQTQITSCSASGTTDTVTTTTPHNLVVGTTIQISGSSVAGYNGNWTVATVPSTTTFTYTNTASGLSAATGGNVVCPIDMNIVLNAVDATNKPMNFPTSTPFSANSTYVPGNAVSYNGAYYVCNTAITTPGVWAGGNWTAVTPFSSATS